jgi:hypothetical protein
LSTSYARGRRTQTFIANLLHVPASVAFFVRLSHVGATTLRILSIYAADVTILAIALAANYFASAPMV